jgi:hypothetical protein
VEQEEVLIEGKMQPAGEEGECEPLLRLGFLLGLGFQQQERATFPEGFQHVLTNIFLKNITKINHQQI